MLYGQLLLASTALCYINYGAIGNFQAPRQPAAQTVTILTILTLLTLTLLTLLTLLTILTLLTLLTILTLLTLLTLLNLLTLLTLLILNRRGYGFPRLPAFYLPECGEHRGMATGSQGV